RGGRQATVFERFEPRAYAACGGVMTRPAPWRPGRCPMSQPGREKHGDAPFGTGLRYNEIAIATGAQTERRGLAGPVRVPLGGEPSPPACLNPITLPCPRFRATPPLRRGSGGVLPRIAGSWQGPGRFSRPTPPPACTN